MVRLLSDRYFGDVDHLVTHTFPLERAEDAFKLKQPSHGSTHRLFACDMT